MSDALKVCTRCSELKPLEAFYFVSKKLGTRRGQCKACMSDVKAMQKDPTWKPSCSGCGRKMERFGPGRRLCRQCFDKRYDEQAQRANGSHRLALKPCSACGEKRLREDHVHGTSLCGVCRSVPQSRRKRLASFNLTPRMYVEMLEYQNYCCWICDRAFTKTLVPHVDHQHKPPSIVRGLVCNGCNTLMAVARDSPERLRGAAKYLEVLPAQRMYPGLTARPEANRRSEFNILARRPALDASIGTR